METRHIRIEREDAVALKKVGLNSQINILEILKRLKSYRQLRKKEFVLRTELKADLAILHTKVNSAVASLPEYFPPVHEKKAHGSHRAETRDIHKELEEIKEKLARLQ